MYGYLNTSESPLPTAQARAKTLDNAENTRASIVEYGWTAAAILIDVAWFALCVFTLVAPIVGFWLGMR